MVDFCFAAADSQNVWESVPFLAVWQARHSSNRPTTTDDGHHCRSSAQACSRWVTSSCSSSSYWSAVFAESSVLMMRFLQQNTLTHIHTQNTDLRSLKLLWKFLRNFPCFKKVVLKISKKIFLLQEVGLEVFLEFFLLELLELNHGFLFCFRKILFSLRHPSIYSNKSSSLQELPLYTTSYEWQTCALGTGLTLIQYWKWICNYSHSNSI